MQPPKIFPEGNLKLVEMDGKTVVTVHAELPSNGSNRSRIQNMRLNMLMFNPKLDLRIVENNAY